MKPGDTVYWGPRFAPRHGTLVRIERNRPTVKRGQRLGSWTNRFYRDMALIQYHRGPLIWVKASKLRKETP